MPLNSSVPRLSRSFLPRKVCVAAAQAIVSRGDKFVSATTSLITTTTDVTNTNNVRDSNQEKITRQDTIPIQRISTKPILQKVVQKALDESGLALSDLDGIVAVPSLADPHFMESHHQATKLGLFELSKKKRSLWCRTIDTGGAGPISAVNAASTLIQANKAEVIAVISVDAVGSLDGLTFSQRADQSCQSHDNPLPSPVIPHGYNRITEYQLKKYSKTLTRDQLRMVPVIESIHARIHPEALTETEYSLDDVRNSRVIAPNISLLECARRADGGSCIILASNHFLRERRQEKSSNLKSEPIIYPVILGTGEASGPLYPPRNEISSEHYFSCESAMMQAYEDSQLSPLDIDFFGLYDCFPICLIRAIESCGLATKGRGGQYIQKQLLEYESAKSKGSEKAIEELLSNPKWFPVNTHGGLLCYGAPWEVPASFNLVEAVNQLRGEAKGRQIDGCRRALVYGNGGIFSSSAVCIIGRGRYGE